MMPVWLISIIARTGVPQRFQRVAAWIAGVAFLALVAGLLVLAFCSWVSNQRTEAVKGDRALSAAEANTIAARAEAIASANMVEQVRTDTINDEELHHEVRKGDDRAVGPGTIAVLDRLRQQQAEGSRTQTTR